MQCPVCSGSGTLPRPERQPQMGELPYFGAHHTSFPVLCNTCSGSGDVPAKKPEHEGQAPTF